MTTTKTLNDFTYVQTRFSGLTQTVVHYHPDKTGPSMLYEIRKEYACTQCGETVEIIVYKAGVTSKRQMQFFESCVEMVLCPSCYTGTDKAVEGAAEALACLLN